VVNELAYRQPAALRFELTEMGGTQSEQDLIKSVGNRAILLDHGRIVAMGDAEISVAYQQAA